MMRCLPMSFALRRPCSPISSTMTAREKPCSPRRGWRFPGRLPNAGVPNFSNAIQALPVLRDAASGKRLCQPAARERRHRSRGTAAAVAERTIAAVALARRAPHRPGRGSDHGQVERRQRRDGRRRRRRRIGQDRRFRGADHADRRAENVLHRAAAVADRPGLENPDRAADRRRDGEAIRRQDRFRRYRRAGTARPDLHAACRTANWGSWSMRRRWSR